MMWDFGPAIRLLAILILVGAAFLMGLSFLVGALFF